MKPFGTGEDEVYAIIRSTTAVVQKESTLSLAVFVTYRLVPGCKNVVMKLLMALKTPREC